jgi:hypothetical protein
MCVVEQEVIVRTIDVSKLPMVLDKIRGIVEETIDIKGPLIGKMLDGRCLITATPAFHSPQPFTTAAQMRGEIRVKIKCLELKDVYDCLRILGENIRELALIDIP